MDCPYCIPGQRKCVAHRSDVYQPSKRQRKRDKEIIKEQRRLNRRPPALNPLGGQAQQQFGAQQSPFAAAQAQQFPGQHFGVQQFPGQYFGGQYFGGQYFGAGQAQQPFGGQVQQPFGAQQPLFAVGQARQQFGGQQPSFTAGQVQQPPSVSSKSESKPTATDKAVRTLNPGSLPLRPRKPQGQELIVDDQTTPIKPSIFKQNEDNINTTSGAQGVEYSPDSPSQVRSSAPQHLLAKSPTTLEWILQTKLLPS
jgi:hypothetical protein